jgi:hypothetical protein
MKIWQKYPIFTVLYVMIVLSSPLWLVRIRSLADWTPVIVSIAMLFVLVVFEIENDWVVFKRMFRNRVKLQCSRR